MEILIAAFIGVWMLSASILVYKRLKKDFDETDGGRKYK